MTSISGSSRSVVDKMQFLDEEPLSARSGLCVHRAGQRHSKALVNATATATATAAAAGRCRGESVPVGLQLGPGWPAHASRRGRPPSFLLHRRCACTLARPFCLGARAVLACAGKYWVPLTGALLLCKTVPL